MEDLSIPGTTKGTRALPSSTRARASGFVLQMATYAGRPAFHHSLPAGRRGWLQQNNGGSRNSDRSSLCAAAHVNSFPSPPPSPQHNASSLNASTSDAHASNQRNRTQVIASMTTICTLSCQTRKQIWPAAFAASTTALLRQCTLLNIVHEARNRNHVPGQAKQIHRPFVM